eukprot:415004_1
MSFISFVKVSPSIGHRILVHQSEHFLKLLSIACIPPVLSSIYMYCNQKSVNNKVLSYWYILSSIINSILVYLVDYILPYIVCQWINTEFATKLFMLVAGTDWLFRIFWYTFSKTFNNHSHFEFDYLLFWKLCDYSNKYITLPILIYFLNHNKLQYQVWDSNQMNDFSKLHHNKTHYRAILALYIITVLTYISGSCYAFYFKDEMTFTDTFVCELIYIIPLLSILILLIYEKYFCQYHSSDPSHTHHIYLMFWFMVVQNSLHECAIFVFVVHHFTTVLSKNIAKVIMFITYTIYFQILSILGYMLSEQISSNEKISFDVQFAFIVFKDVYLTMFLSLSAELHILSVVLIIIIKVIDTLIQFDHRLIKLRPWCNNINTKQLAVTYVYSFLSTCSVYLGQIIILLVDYIDDSVWMANSSKTAHNLQMVIIVLGVSFFAEILAIASVIYYAKTSNSISHSQNYNMQNIKSILTVIPAFYFICVVSYSQVSCLQVTKFFAASYPRS